MIRNFTKSKAPFNQGAFLIFNIMGKTFTEKDLVDFGNYLLSEKRESTIEDKESIREVHQEDLDNFKALEHPLDSYEEISYAKNRYMYFWRKQIKILCKNNITTEIENILAERVIEFQIKGLHPSIILMNKYTFKKLIKSINKSCKIVSLKDYKKNQKWFFGVKIYITKDLSNGEIIVK